MTTLSQGRSAGDLVVHMESSEYCTTSATVKGQHTSGTLDLADPVNYPVILSGTQYKLAKSGDEASVVGFIMQGPPIEDLAVDTATKATQPYQILKNPPAILNKDKIPTTDYNGASFNVTTMVTALKTLKFEVRTEATKSTTQTE